MYTVKIFTLYPETFPWTFSWRNLWKGHEKWPMEFKNCKY